MSEANRRRNFPIASFSRYRSSNKVNTEIFHMHRETNVDCDGQFPSRINIAVLYATRRDVKPTSAGVRNTIARKASDVMEFRRCDPSRHDPAVVFRSPRTANTIPLERKSACSIAKKKTKK